MPLAADEVAPWLTADLSMSIEGRDVIIVEDIIDTGLTLNYLVRTFELRRTTPFVT